MNPLVYVYKITFVEVPHWYWGWHSERKAGEHYMGSPATHKQYWEHYTPIKELIKVFEHTPEGKLKAQLFEKELIRPDLNNPLCLNESCSGVISTEINSKTASRVMTERWADPEQRKIMEERAIRRWDDPHLRKKMAEEMSERSKKFWEDEEYRKRRSEWGNKVFTEKWNDPKWRDKELKAKPERVRGEKNPMFGMVYVTDGTIDGTRIVPQGDPVPEGYIQGRFLLNEPFFKAADWLHVVDTAGIDFKKWGWKTRVCKLLGISIYHAEKFFTPDRLGFEPFKKSQS